MDNSSNLDELIDTKPIGALQWRVVVLCFLLAVIDGFDASSIGYVAPVLAEQFAIESALEPVPPGSGPTTRSE